MYIVRRGHLEPVPSNDKFLVTNPSDNESLRVTDEKNRRTGSIGVHESDTIGSLPPLLSPYLSRRKDTEGVGVRGP